MTAMMALVAAAVLSAAGQAQAPEPAKTRTIWVYLIDRTRPDRVFDDAAASLRIESRSGRGETFLLARATREGADPGKGAIRGLVGTPYFVEAFWGNPESQPEAGSDLLRKVHRTPCFMARVPESSLAGARVATLTIRLGSVSYTSEDYRDPGAPEKTAQAGLEEVEKALGALKERAVAGASFMNVRPAARELLGTLALLAPAGFMDASGAYEQDRQWCLAAARAILDACDAADWGRIQELCLQVPPRLQKMQATGPPPASPTESPAVR